MRSNPQTNNEALSTVRKHWMNSDVQTVLGLCKGFFRDILLFREHLGAYWVPLDLGSVPSGLQFLWCNSHVVCFQASYQHFRLAGLQFTRFSSWPVRILRNMVLWTWSRCQQMVRASLGLADGDRQQITELVKETLPQQTETLQDGDMKCLFPRGIINICY